MEYLTAKKFSFQIKGLSEDTFGVVNFTGTEEISKLYEFTILLVSDNIEIDFKSVINKTAKLIFHRGKGGDVAYNGIIAHFEQLNKVNNYAFYRAHLVPKLWRLSMTQYNQIFLDKTVQQFIKEILVNEGLTVQDYEFRIQGSFEPLEYVCQYGESNFNFISRWLEREGIYYYFEQTDNGEKVIFINSKVSHIDLPGAGELIFSPPSALETFHKEESITSLHCRQTLMPAKVLLKDYSDLKPSFEITGEAEVDSNGFGTVYNYQEYIKSPGEGKHLAKIIAEGFLCRQEEYLCEGSVPFMLPGYTFSLQKHFRKDFNRKYLIISITHEGDQSGYLLTGIQTGDGDEEHKADYRNSFVSIPMDIQFRPERKAYKPRISGTINGKIDAGGSGQYAELDGYGRYKVTIPFDVSGRKDGKASAWIRMAQPYAGSNHGMHFPLHKGTEVLLTFIGGDPDRPVIASAIPNTENPSVVSGGNATQSGFTTAGGNSIHMDDTDGSQHMVLRTGDNATVFQLGGSDSTSGVTASSQWWFSAAQNGFIQTCMGFLDLYSAVQARTVTGWMKMQTAFNVINKAIIQKALPLAGKIMADKAKQEGKGTEPVVDPKDAKWNDAGTIAGIVAPIAALALEIIKRLVQKSYLAKAIRKKGSLANIPERMDILNNSRFQVTCIDDATFTQQGQSQWFTPEKRHISLVAADNNAKIMTFSDDNTHIIAGSDVNIDAGYDLNIRTGNETKITAETGVSIRVENDAWQGSSMECDLNNFNINGSVINLTTPATGNKPNIKINNNKSVTVKINNTSIMVEDNRITVQTSQNGNKITLDKESILLQNGNNSKVLLDKDFAKIGAGGSGISVLKDGNIVVVAKQGKEYKMGPIKINKQGKVNIQ